MNTTSIMEMMYNQEMAFYALAMLELTGYMFSSPANLQNNNSFDYIFVGGGTAGVICSTKLAQNDINVLLIEGGPDAPFETTNPKLLTYVLGTHVDWNRTSENDEVCYQCHDKDVLHLNQGRMIGGSGGLMWMIYSRGNLQKFDEWFELTKDPTWKSENVLPYFMSIENVVDSEIQKSKFNQTFGTKGNIIVTRDEHNSTYEVLTGFQQVGKDIIPDIDGSRLGYSKALLLIGNDTRQNVGPIYQSLVTSNEYIAVGKNTRATKIVFDKENKKAVAVEAITYDGNKVTLKARKEIIISAGALGTPQLLMLSGIGPREQLEKFNITTIRDIPVGKELMDIQAVVLIHTINKPMIDEPLESGKYPAEVYVGYASKYSSTDEFPRYTANILVINNKSFLVEFLLDLKFKKDIIDKLIRKTGNKQVILTLLGNLYDKSSGQVTLRSADPKDSPKVESYCFSDREDVYDLIDNIRDYLKVEQSEAWKKLQATRIDLTKPKCDNFSADSNEYWECHNLCMMVSLKVFSGTCPMTGVVDSRLRVRGIKNLRVVDSSVMPTNIGGMTYNAVAMIATKAAEFIMEDAGEEYLSMKHQKISKDQILNIYDDSILY